MFEPSQWFKNNLAIIPADKKLSEDAANALNAAFFWEATPQGQTYWDTLYFKDRVFTEQDRMAISMILNIPIERKSIKEFM